MTLRYSFDEETLKNYFCLCVVNIDDPTDRRAFEVYKGHSDFDALMEFVNRPIVLIGYNNLKFDGIILKAAMMHVVNSVRGIYELAGHIIRNNYDKINNYWDIWNYAVAFEQIDVMALHRLHTLGVGLKMGGVIIKHPKIQDLPIAPDQLIAPHERKLVRDYCFNDCDITRGMFLYDQTQDELAVRQELTEIFGVDVRTMSRPQAGQKILLQLYSQTTNIPTWELKKQNSDRSSIAIKDCIIATIKFETDYLNEFRTVLESLTLYKNTRPTNYELTVANNKVEQFNPLRHSLGSNVFPIKRMGNFRYTACVTLAGKTFDVGIGGLHSRDEPNIFKTNDEYELLLADVSSYYPSLQSEYKIRPAHLDETYNDILDDLIARKFNSQKEGKADNITFGFKIVINALYGQMGDVYSPFLDQQAMTSVTMSGQLGLLDLIEKVDLGLTKTKLLSANTDGVLYLVHKSEKTKFKEVCEGWANRLRMNLDYDPFKLIVMRDVNNYLGIKANGKVKTKGVFVTGELKNGRWEKPLEKGYDAPIVAIALYKYFVDGVSYEDTIMNHTDIYDFMICKKVGRQFNTVIYKEDGTHEIQQKTNRFIITTEGISLVKIHKEDGHVENMVKNELMQVLNDVEELDVKKYPIRYSYYLDRVKKIIDLVDPPQKELF